MGPERAIAECHEHLCARLCLATRTRICPRRCSDNTQEKPQPGNGRGIDGIWVRTSAETSLPDQCHGAMKVQRKSPDQWAGPGLKWHGVGGKAVWPLRAIPILGL